jgi:predicted ATPase
VEALNRNAFITARLQAKQIAVDRRIILDEKKVFFDRIIPKYTTMFCLKSSSKMM